MKVCDGSNGFKIRSRTEAFQRSMRLNVGTCAVVSGMLPLLRLLDKTFEDGGYFVLVLVVVWAMSILSIL